MDFQKDALRNKKIAAAIRRIDDIPEALNHPDIETIFLLGGDINILPAIVKKVKQANKILLVHMDLLAGVGKDNAGIQLLMRMGVPGIVSTKTNLVKLAKKEGLWVVQRFFIVDSESLKTAVKVVHESTPDAVEILPATVPRYVIEEMKKNTGLPVLAGGLLKTEEDVKEAFSKGIDAISTSLRYIWNLKI